MASTYEPIATTTVAVAAATITFSGIASSWTDLRVVLVATSSSALAGPRIQFNSDTATNYSYTNLKGDGTSATSNRSTSNNYLQAQGINLTTTPSLLSYDIFSYTGSTFKTVLTSSSQDYNGSGTVQNQVGLWRSTSAITSITFSGAGLFVFDAGTTATLYGIKAA